MRKKKKKDLKNNCLNSKKMAIILKLKIQMKKKIKKKKTVKKRKVALNPVVKNLKKEAKVKKKIENPS